MWRLLYFNVGKKMLSKNYYGVKKKKLKKNDVYFAQRVFILKKYVCI